MKFLRWSIPVVFLALALLACSLPGRSAPTPTAAPALPTDPPTPTLAPTPAPTATPSAPSSLDFSDQSETVTETNPPYELRLHYPRFEGDSAAAADLNRRVQEQVDSLRQGFAADAAVNEEWRLQNMPESGSSLDLSYTVAYNQRGLLSLRWDVGFYVAGAAHPNSYSLTLNYDLFTQQAIALESLFQSGAPYLTELQSNCTDQLSPILSDMLFAEGLTPLPENYARWVFTPQGFEFTFDPYQVAPYAAGPQTVRVPYAQLQAHYRPESPLMRILTTP